MSKNKQTQIVDWLDIKPKSYGVAKPLKELVNQEFLIVGAEFYKGMYGDFAIVTVRVKGEDVKYRTSSQVLIEQLKKMKQYLDKGIAVKVRLRKRKRYYTFA